MLVPALIGAITLASRHWGPAVAGWLSGFPIVTGPILLFVALEQGAQFASVTAAGALAGRLAWMSFALSYAWAATQTSWLLALFIGLSAYLVVGMVLVLSAPPFTLIAVMVVVVYFAGRALARAMDHAQNQTARPGLDIEAGRAVIRRTLHPVSAAT